MLWNSQGRLNLTTKVYLHFADGNVFTAKTNLEINDDRLLKGIWGEAAFTTGHTGYQETITDPSFLGQHIIFSSPHIGNYPADSLVNQSNKSHATSLIAPHFTPNPFLQELDIPLIGPDDNRSLVKYLSSNPSPIRTSLMVITNNPKPPPLKEFNASQLICNEIERVGLPQNEILIPGENPIVILDYGSKKNILNELMKLNYPLVVLGVYATLSEIKNLDPRMIFISNGPGDPSLYISQIALIKELMQLNIPLRAICLGHQLLGLALGIKTIKLPFGHRGCNHPVLDQITGKVLITSQNHGYALDSSSFQSIAMPQQNFLRKEFFITHSSLFDQSIEGIASTDHFIKSVQFHPEAAPGPHDALPFFQEIAHILKTPPRRSLNPIKTTDLHLPRPLNNLRNLKTPKNIPYKRVLLIGSGPIRIGQASEFDYSGTQAALAFKAEGIEVILLNSNPATIMTDHDIAYKTYIEPINLPTVKRIIEKENIDAICSTMGGQTALNLCMELDRSGFLKKHNITLLGAGSETIAKTEDRHLFAKELEKLGYKSGKRFQVNSQEEAIKIAQSEIGFPLMIRRDFALGGQGAKIISSLEELVSSINSDEQIKFPMTLEKSLIGFKEIELEIMIDSEQNGVIICSIENVDPCGVHTGDSITVAPAQTISDCCYQQLRTMSLNIGKAVGLVAGGANVQFAINPYDENDIIVIEMNPRVSRSSALASKATGYPIAKISTLLSLGYSLKEILNDITKASPVSFEPTMDYVAVKIPYFPFDKFPLSKTILGPQMRAVGEVLALGSNFLEAFMKALRSLEMNLEIPALSKAKNYPQNLTREIIKTHLEERHPLCLLWVLEALRLNCEIKEIFKWSSISPWFISQMLEFRNLERNLTHNIHNILETDPERFIHYKQHGFSDKYMAHLLKVSEESLFSYRKENNIFPTFKAVDTCSGEFLAKTPYFYSTYQKQTEPTPLIGQSVVILGSGPNRIGQGIEFDYSCVKSAQALQNHKINSIMINSNPETVSTDYDNSNRLYLSPLYAEDVFDILLFEKPHGIITCFSGQTGIHLRREIETTFRQKIYQPPFLGSSWETIQKTEDRKLFDQVLEEVDIHRTKSLMAKGYDQLIKVMDLIGFPVIIRPNFVIGGESMFIFHSVDDLSQLPADIISLLQSSQLPLEFLVENYIENAYEYDVDLVRDQFNHSVFTICEHIEFAGVHSGDSGMITPPVHLTHSLKKRLIELTQIMSEKLNVIGPINFQFAIKGKEIYCIEANPRGSRTIPFLSKAFNISLPQLAVQAMLGKSIPNMQLTDLKIFCVKQATFPFDRFIQDDILLGPKMRSTGETMGIDFDRDQAILKSYIGNYPKLKDVGKILLSLADHHKPLLTPYLRPLHNMGYEFYATTGTYETIRRHGLPCTKVAKIGEEGQTILESLRKQNIMMVLNTPGSQNKSMRDGESIRMIATSRDIPVFTRIENIKVIMESLIGCQHHKAEPIALQEIYK